MAVHYRLFGVQPVLCGSDEVLYVFPRAGGPHPEVTCGECALLYLHYRNDRSKIRELFRHVECGFETWADTPKTWI